MKKFKCFWVVYKWFKEGHKNVEGYERSGHPRPQGTDENVEKVQNLMHSDRRFSIRAVAM